MKTVPTLLVPALAALVLTSCVGGSDDSGAPQVAVASYPWEFVVDRVGGDRVSVDNLTQPGAEPHSVELTSSELAGLLDADLVVFQSGFQPAVDDALADNDTDEQVRLDVSDVVPLVGDDPHVWLDPDRMVAVTEAVVDELAAVDPDHAQEFEANGARLVRELQALDRDFRAGLASCRRDTIVTGHAAFGYLADAYGLDQVAVAGLDPESEPSPSDQAEIADLVQEQGVTTVFAEPLASSAVADSIADEAGVTLSTLDPVEGLSDDTRDETYLTLMRSNLESIREANDCR